MTVYRVAVARARALHALHDVRRELNEDICGKLLGVIAAKLSIASGADDSDIDDAIDDADALIGSLVVPPVGSGSLATSSTSSLNDELAGFNEGNTGPGHCDDENGDE